MFDSIAPVYDRLNHLLSFGIDRSWRRRLVRAVSSFCALRGGEVKVLDMACGTGDVSIALRRNGLDVVGADISENMLALARKKAPEIDFRYGDASELPFADGSFDAVTIAFGIRNFDKRAQCIRELHRVLKDGGMLAIAEFSIPVSKQAYAYSYLPESSFDFPAPEKFRAELSEGGFREVTARSMTGGVSYLYIGRK